MFFSLTELSNVLVFVWILEVSHTMRNFIHKLPSIDTPIWINHATLSLFDALEKLSYIHKMVDLVLVVPVSMFNSILPLTFIVLLRGVKNSRTVF